ncbi:hypothetical protein FS749_014169 [Ceratobasidium sp. UAMH 11750]|nr:hypothetical protein FS749_014169 [Ceratobasidium sp. UAMH 11750]
MGGGVGGSTGGPSPGPMLGRIEGGGTPGKPKLGLHMASSLALPDEDAPAPQLQPVDPSASLTSLRPKLQLHAASTGDVERRKLRLALPGSQQAGGGGGKLAAPSFKLDLSTMRGADSEDEVDYSYYGKPTTNRANSISPGLPAGRSESFPSDSSAATLRPPSTTTAVPSCIIHHPGRVGDRLDKVCRAINELRMPSSQTYDESTEAKADKTVGG